MVNIIENLAFITGIVMSVSPEPDTKELYQISFKLLRADDLDELPNLARADEGNEIQIRMQKSFIDENGVTPGNEISISVRKAFGQVYFTREQ